MSVLNERVSYIKGMMDGMKLDTTTNEGKLLSEMVKLLEDFALAYEELDEDLALLEDQIDEVEEYVEIVDEDLADLEEELFDEDFLDEDVEVFECPECGGPVYIDLDDLLDDEDVEVLCDHCGTIIEIVDDLHEKGECVGEECETKE